jgi:diacylglycerol kinase (ATP)
MNKSFSISARLKSIGHALAGIKSALQREPNLRLHLIATVLTGLLLFVIHVTKVELILLLIVIGLVWAAELFNTAIEKVMDAVSIQRDPAVKFIKDVAAAAVLITAVMALITGSIILLPKLYLYVFS